MPEFDNISPLNLPGPADEAEGAAQRFPPIPENLILRSQPAIDNPPAMPPYQLPPGATLYSTQSELANAAFSHPRRQALIHFNSPPWTDEEPQDLSSIPGILNPPANYSTSPIVANINQDKVQASVRFQQKFFETYKDLPWALAAFKKLAFGIENRLINEGQMYCGLYSILYYTKKLDLFAGDLELFQPKSWKELDLVEFHKRLEEDVDKQMKAEEERFAANSDGFDPSEFINFPSSSP